MPTAVATLIPAGLTAITNALTSGLPLEVSKWELGSAPDIEVPGSSTSALPSAIYTGSPSNVLLEQENGLAVFNIVIDESIGDFYIGNVALHVVDPVTQESVLLGVIMFPEALFKMRSVAFGGPAGETGRYYVAKLVIKLSTSSAVATIEVGNTNFSVIPSVDDLSKLAAPTETPYPHLVMLKGPETGAPTLLAKRAGDGLWWGFSFSWPVTAHNFGIIGGGYQGDWYATDNVEVVFGGYFHLLDSDFDGIIEGGSNWLSPNINLIDGGTWS